MNLPELAIRRPVLALMMNAVIVVFGAISFSRIGLDRYPYVEFPMISVTTTLQGASPEIVDASVANIVESAVNSVPGIEHVQSDSAPGVSIVRIMFELEKDIDVAFNEVKAKIDRVLRDLPRQADPPVVAKIEFGAIPVLWVAVHGDRTLQQLNQYARKVLKKRIENIDGVGEVRFGGRRERTIRVNLDVDWMSAVGVTAGDVVRAFRHEHLQMPGGFLVGREDEFMVKLDLEFHKPEELRNLVVVYRDGAPVRLGDVATVEDGIDDNRKAARFNGEPTVALGVVKVRGANAVAVVRAIERRLQEEILPNLPPGLRVDVAYNDADLILDLVGALKEHLVLGTLLTAFVVWLFLQSLWATALIAIAIPVSLLGAIAIIYFTGYTFNTMTLLALVLLIGVVVDDAIVVLENIYRHQETRRGPRASTALSGTNEVVFAVVAASLTLVSIFAPVVFMGGILGRFYRSFAVVVTCGVLASLFVSITLTPMLCSRYLRVTTHRGPIAAFFESIFGGMERGYRWLLDGALRYRWSVVGVMVLALVPSAYFVSHIDKGLLPREDEGRFLASFKTPLGSNLAYTDARLRAIEGVLSQHEEIADYLATIGGGTSEQTSKGEITIRLTPREERQTHMYTLINRLRDELGAIPGVQAFPAPIPPLGGQRGEPVQFVLVGPDMDGVAHWSDRLNERLAAMPELGRVDLDLQLDLPQIELKVDRTRAADAGLSTEDVVLAANVLVGGFDVAKYNDIPGDGERYDVRLKARAGLFMRPADFDNIYLRGRNAGPVRLETVAQPMATLGPAVITRFDMRYSGNFFCTPIAAQGEAINKIMEAAAELLPHGYAVKMVGQAEEFGKTTKYVQFALVTAALLVFMVLASQFDSLVQPVILMVAQPLAMVGGLGALWVSRLSLNIFSMIGLVLLMGLVAKNSILLVDLTNQFRAQGRGIEEALREACPIRLRPVLMTSLTIIITMMPAALGLGAGADTNAPLAVAVIGGMVSSTLLALVAVPAVYSLVENGVASATARLRGRRRTVMPGDSEAQG